LLVILTFHCILKFKMGFGISPILGVLPNP